MERGRTEIKVWVNGSFDVLHLGHIKLLEYASSLGKVRVGLDTDERIKIKKGSNRPYNNLNERTEFISSIKYVDSVVTFSTDEELENCIKDYNPDIMVIGGDYKTSKIIGEELIPKIYFFERIENKSTTRILNYEDTSNRGTVY